MKPLIFIFLLLALPAYLPAAPYVPRSDAEILERLPLKASDQNESELRKLRTALNRDPRNVQLAATVAQRYIEAGRAQSDPRYFGYAEAALRPWWDAQKIPVQILILRATLRQSVHRFDEALADLNQVLLRVPGHPQALLTRATIQQVRGNFSAAKADCGALAELADELVSATCMSGVDALTGALRPSYEKLRAILNRNPHIDPSLRSWVTTLLAEMALRGAMTAAAGQHFKAALATDASDAYLLGAYADFLLEQSRAREVIELLKDHGRADPLLLRTALAQKALQSPELATTTRALQARFEAARRRGDAVHLREEARFALHLLNRPPDALALAQQNWQVQKEPADARILLEAALAAGDRATAQAIARWVRENRLEDVALTERLSALSAPG